MKTYDFLKVKFIYNPTELKVGKFSEYRSNRNFIRKNGKKRNQELEM